MGWIRNVYVTFSSKLEKERLAVMVGMDVRII
jgi:hypothetical protein